MSDTPTWSEKIEAVPEVALRRYFTADFPLGPLNASLIAKEHRAITELLSERDLAPIKRVVSRPSIVIGRRGSGKTSYLRKLSLTTPIDLFLELRTDKTLNLILGAVHNLIRDSITVEAIAEIWDAIFWDCLFWLLHRTGKPTIGRMEVLHHLKAMEIESCKSIDEVLAVLSRNIQRIARETSGFAIARTAEHLQGKYFESLQQYSISDLTKRQVSALIVLDSFDEYPINVDDFRKALSGLLKCAGEFNSISRNFDLRLCIPSELYWSFSEKVSTNPQKDFSNKLIVHWRVTDLLVTVCRRFLIYLRLQHPRAYGLVRSNPLNLKIDVDNFFSAIFPSHVANSNGRHERTQDYILRHTQLLPRQLILILTEILRLNTVDDCFTPGTTSFISEQAIRLGIQEAEDTIVEEIFSAYRDRFGDLPKEACLAILPSLPRVFRVEDLNKAVRNYAEQHGRTIPPAPIRKLLLEIGVLGKLEGKGSGYIQGKFEYTLTNRLAIGQDDKLCVHPLFSRIFDCQANSDDPPIFPHSADL
jgi:hypothetical protein